MVALTSLSVNGRRSLEVEVGAAVARGAPLAVLSAMKMEHVVPAPRAGTVARLRARAGDAVGEGATLALPRAINDGYSSWR
jgi:biotin carboxyl carrier protein